MNPCNVFHCTYQYIYTRDQSKETYEIWRSSLSSVNCQTFISVAISPAGTVAFSIIRASSIWQRDDGARIWVNISIDWNGVRESDLDGLSCMSKITSITSKQAYLSGLIDEDYIADIAPAVWIINHIAVYINATWTILLE